MNKRTVLAYVITGFLFLLVPSSAAPDNDALLAAKITAATEKWLALLSSDQRFDAVRPYSDERPDWHFIPRPQRKGVSLQNMTVPQRKAAFDILRLLTSSSGYDKARMTMKQQGYLKKKLNQNPPHCCGKYGTQCSQWDPTKPKSQQTPGCPSLYDEQFYFVSLFGLPSAMGNWGLSFEGHHLSLNYTFDGGKIIGSTPTAFGSDPAIMMSSDYPPIPKGTRLLTDIDDLGMDLMNALTPDQKKITASTMPYTSNLWDAGGPQPLGAYPPWGLAASAMNDDQKKILHRLIGKFADDNPAEIAASRLSEANADFDNLHFAFFGTPQPGKPRQYRIQGTSIIIELSNSQPDPLGNPCNHIHSTWRNLKGDFGTPNLIYPSH